MKLFSFVLSDVNVSESKTISKILLTNLLSNGIKSFMACLLCISEMFYFMSELKKKKKPSYLQPLFPFL